MTARPRRRTPPPTVPGSGGVPERARRPLEAVAVVLVLLAGCSNGDLVPGEGTAEPRRGGSVVLGAEQWPECLNPVTSCANAAWTHWTVLQAVLPKLMTLDAQGNYVPSPVLAGEPTTTDGGVTEGPFTVTFRLDPDAVWDDGTAITSDDVAFTAQAYRQTTGSAAADAYERIDRVETPDDRTAVVVFDEPYAPWRELFGGAWSYVLKAEAFGRRPDLAGELRSDIPFSGGPWILSDFDGRRIALVRNERYAGEPALLDEVTFVPLTDHDAQVEALLTGDVAAVHPQPAAATREQLDDADGVAFRVGAGTAYEGLWPNHDEDPLSSRRVREALAYALDRHTVVEAVVEPLYRDAEVLQCAGWVPGAGGWCDPSDFERYRYDPDRAKAILEADGWSAGPDGVFQRAGERLEVVVSTTTGSDRREDVQDLLADRARAGGFDLRLETVPAQRLFTDRLPRRDFVLAEYAEVAAPDPSVAALYGCDAIPSDANGFSGTNFTGWCNEAAAELSRRADRTLDPDERRRLLHAVGDLVADEVAWMPLFQHPVLTAWRDDRLAGPVGAYTTSPLGPFANLERWYLR